MKRNRFIRARVVWWAVVLALAGLVAAPAAHAQPDKKKDTTLSPPVPPPGKSDIPWAPYIFAILLMMIIVGVNFIPSKRGHQD